MLPRWMQTAQSGNDTILPTKALLLRRALSGIKLDPSAKFRDDRVPFEKVYDSLSDSAKGFAASVNSILGSAVDALPGDPSSNPFRANADYVNETVSQARKNELLRQQNERGAIDDSDLLGRATLKARQIARNPLQSVATGAGNILPTALAGAGLVAAGAPAVAATTGIGAVLGTGAVRGGIYDSVMSAGDEQLMGDQDYSAMRALGMSEQSAKKKLADKLSSYGENPGKIALGAILGAASGRLGADAKLAQVLSGNIRNSASRIMVNEIAKKSVLAEAAKSAGREVGTEVAQEGLENYLANLGAGSGGATIDPMEGVPEAMIEAGLTSLIPGAAAGAGEVQSARARKEINDSQDAARLARGLQSRANAGRVVPPAPAPPVAPAPNAAAPGAVKPPAELAPEARSPRPEVSDGEEAVVYNGQMQGVSPYNSLVSAGYPATKETEKLAKKLGNSVGRLAREAKKNAVKDPDVAGLGLDPRVAAKIADTKARLEAERAAAPATPVAEQAPAEMVEETLPPLTPQDDEANRILDEIEASNPDTAPYQVLTTNRSDIWSPDRNPVTAAPRLETGTDQSMVPDQLELVDESTPKLEVVEENPLENIPNQSAINQPAPETRVAPEVAPVETPQKSEFVKTRFKPAPYYYEGDPIMITPEQEDQLEVVDRAIAQAKRNAQQPSWTEDQKKSYLKGVGMRAAYQKRRILGKATAKEQAAEAKRLASNYVGKRVVVDGRKAEVVANPFGKVTVKFEDGSKATVEKDKISELKQQFARAYHGTPHRFDKFEYNDKTRGTGDGTQERGDGLYFAENEYISKIYANQHPANSHLKLPKGNVYNVDIPDEVVGKMLDWDKPFADQPKSVQDAIRSNGDLRKALLPPKGMEDIPMGDAFKSMEYILGRRYLEPRMAKSGIPGIKYLDDFSSSSGEGTRNFVVFNPDDVTILTRNGEKISGQQKSDAIGDLQEQHPETSKSGRQANRPPGESDSIPKRIWQNYNGITEEQRDETYPSAEQNPAAQVKGVPGMIVFNPENDMHPFAIQKMAQWGNLTRTLRNVMLRIGQSSGVTSAKFGGLTGAGPLMGVNMTESGRIYVNPALIAKHQGFSAKATAKEIVHTLAHELAHEKYDPGDHSPEVFGKELERILDIIAPILPELEAAIARDLDMTEIRAVADIQAAPWGTAYAKGKAIVEAQVKAEPVVYNKVSLRGTNETKSEGQGRAASGGVSSPSGERDSGGSGKSAVHDRSIGQPRDSGERKVPRATAKPPEGVASGSDSGGGDGNAGSVNEDASGGESAFQLPAWTKLNDYEESIANRYNRIDQVEKHLGDLARALTPMAAERIRALYSKHVVPMIKYMAEHGVDLNDLDLYARAKQAKVRNETIRRRGGPDGGASISDEDAAKVLKKFEKDEHMQEAHRMLMTIAADQRVTLVNSGLVSAKEMALASAAMGEFYVPLHSDEVQNGINQYVGGIQVKGNDLKYAKGQTGPVKNVVAALIEQANRSIVRAQRNAFMMDLADFIEDHPSDMWNASPKKGTSIDSMVEYHEDGVLRQIQIKDPILLRQIKGMNPTELASFINSMRNFTHFYSKLSTKWNPIFPLTNLIRDTPMGLARVFTNDGGDAAKAVWKGIPEAAKASAYFRINRSKPESEMTHMEKRAMDLLLLGGVPSWQGMEDAATIKSNIERDLSAASKKHGVKNLAMKAASKLANAATIANETVETAMRLSYFDYLMSQEEAKEREQILSVARDKGDKATIEKYSNPDNVPALTRKKKIEIASKVRALTGDFQAHGTASRYLGAFYPFFNASIQGIRSIGELAVQAGKGDKRAQKVFGTLFAVGIMEDILGSALSGDDDDDGVSNYDSMPDWIRRQKYVLPTGDGKSIIIPMTYGLSIAVNAGKMASRVARGQMDVGDYAREMALATNESSNPLNSATLAQMISPLATDWIVQIAENKDWRGEKLFPNRYPGQEWKPNSEITSKKDSAGAKALAKFMNSVTGGSDVEKGALSETPLGDITPYPGAIDATAKWLGGGLGRFAADSVSFLKNVLTREEIDRIPGVSSFYTSPDKYFYAGRFYDQLNELKQIKSMAAGMKANARRQQLLEKFPEKKKIIEAMTAGDLEKAVPVLASNETLKKNFARIGVKKLKLMKMYDSVAKKIKKLEDNDAPDKNERILELVKSIHKKYVAAEE